jgi:hypothetical protein
LPAFLSYRSSLTSLLANLISAHLAPHTLFFPPYIAPSLLFIFFLHLLLLRTCFAISLASFSPTLFFYYLAPHTLSFFSLQHTPYLLFTFLFTQRLARFVFSLLLACFLLLLSYTSAFFVTSLLARLPALYLLASFYLPRFMLRTFLFRLDLVRSGQAIDGLDRRAHRALLSGQRLAAFLTCRIGGGQTFGTLLSRMSSKPPSRTMSMLLSRMSLKLPYRIMSKLLYRISSSLLYGILSTLHWYCINPPASGCPCVMVIAVTRTGRRPWAFPLFRILSPSGYGCVGVSSCRLHRQS